MTRCLTGFSLLILFLTLADPARAQDSQYWDNQYGTRAQLLGGLVVGSASDLSATYYNPGWIAMSTKPALLLTTRAVEYYRLKLANQVDAENSPVSQKFSPSPGFGAVQLKQDPDKNMAIAFSYLVKTNFKFEARAYRIDSDPAPPPDGSLRFAGETFKISEISEHWVGVTLAWKLNDKMAVGVTPYGVLRNQNHRFQLTAQAMSGAGAYADALNVDESYFYHARLLAKTGLAVDMGTYTLGLTVTTPSLGLFGSGTAYRSESASGLDLDGDTLPDIYLAANRQTNLSAAYSSPMSVAIGASRELGNTSLHATVEWFDSVAPAEILDTEPYTAQSSGEVRVHETGYGLRQVFNWGLGLDHRFTDRFALYTSFRSDNSSLDPNASSDVLMSSWNLWHATLGASFTWKALEFTSGLDFSFGDGETGTGLTLSSERSNLIDNALSSTHVQYNKIKFLIGLNLPFSTGIM